MAQIVKLRRTSQAGKIPTTSNLELGELAMNTNDGRIFFEKNDGSATIEEILTTNPNNPTTGSINLNGSLTASSGIQVSANIMPDTDNTLSLGSSTLRFQLNGGTPVTVDGNGTANTITRFQSATTVEDSNIVSSDTATTFTHSNNGNTIFTVSGSNGELLTITDSNTGNLLEVNDASGIDVFTVSAVGDVSASGAITASGIMIIDDISVTGNISGSTFNGTGLISGSAGLSYATSTTRGVVELFSDTTQTVTANTISSTANRTYGIQLNSANQAVVNVPWSDTNTTNLDGTGAVSESAQLDGFISASNSFTANEIIIADDTDSVTSTNLLTIDPDNSRVGVGTSSPATKFHISGEGTNEGQIRLQQANNGSDGPDFAFYSSRGTIASPSAVQNNDTHGRINVYPYNGTSYIQAGSFGWSGTDGTGNNTFDIRSRVSGTLAKRIEITSAGKVKFNDTYEFPTSDGSSNQVLQTNGSGVLSFGTITTYTDSDNTSHLNSLGVISGSSQIIDGSGIVSESAQLDGFVSKSADFTTNELLVADGTNSVVSSNILSLDTTNNYLGINQSNPSVTLHMTGEGAQSAQIRMEQHNDTSDAPDIRTRKSRGTAASPTKNNAGDFIYRQNSERYNGTSYVTVGQLAVDTNSTNADRFQLSLAVSEDGNSIDAADAQFVIDGNDNGAITFNDSYKFPTSDGTNGQALVTNGSGVLSFGAPTADLDGTGVISGSVLRPDGDGVVSESLEGDNQGQIKLNNVNVNVNDLGTDDSPTFTNLTLTGNLTVQGTTTTENSQEVNIGDNILNLNYGGSATEGGILVSDGTGASTTSGSLKWDSTNDYWKAGKLGSEEEILLRNVHGVLSGSSQVVFGDISSIPSGIVSQSSQTVSHLLNQDVDLGTGDLDATIISGSYIRATGTGNSLLVEDTLRIDENGSGLRMTNVGAFENSGGSFHIFSNGDLRLSTNGSGAGTTALTLDQTTKDATFEGNILAGNISGSSFNGTGLFSQSAQVDYNNIQNQPTIPTVNNATLTVQGSGVLGGSGTFTANQSTNGSISITHDAVSRTNNTSTTSPSAGGTFTAIDSITTSNEGHITAVNTKTVTLPAGTTPRAAGTGLSLDSNTLNFSGDGTGVVSGSVLRPDGDDVVSESVQIDVTQTTNYSSINQYTDSDNTAHLTSLDVVSGSASEVRTFLNVADGATNYGDTNVKTKLTAEDVVSGSATEVKSFLSIAASDVSDFDTEVSNNTDVTANTNKVGYGDELVKDKLNNDGVFSQSLQIDVTQTTNYSSINQYTDSDNTSHLNSLDVVSGSATDVRSFLNVADGATNYGDTNVKTKLTAEDVVSGSASEVRTFLNVANGATNYGDTNVKTKLTAEDVVSGSASEVRTFLGVANGATNYGDTDVKNKITEEDVVSGSASDVRTFLNVANGATNYGDTNVKTKLTTEDVVSGSASDVRSFLNVADGATNYGDTDVKDKLTEENVVSSSEQIEDVVGDMVSGNTETGISVTYQDSDGTLDFAVQYGTTSNTALVGTTTVDDVSKTNLISRLAEFNGTDTVYLGDADDDTTIVIRGTLQVDGTTVTVNSETLTVNDNIIVLNNNAADTPTENGGIEVYRGTSDAASILWDETSDSWKVGLRGAEIPIVTTTGTQTLTNKTLTSPDINGGTADSLTSLTIANNVDVGDFEIQAKTFQSDVATGTAPFTVASTTKVSNLNADLLDGLSSAAFIRANANDTATGVITFSDTTQSTNTTSGTLKISGGVGIAKTLNVGEDVVAYASSDERYKDNVTPIENPNEKLKQIGGYTFDWNDKHEVFKGQHDVGVIAQEIEKVLPEIVETRESGYKAVKYEKIVALLIESNKELLKRIEDLESKIK